MNQVSIAARLVQGLLAAVTVFAIATTIQLCLSY
jgi:hypothetical protein